MTNYSIDYNKCSKYLAVIYSASYVNPFENIADITKEIQKKYLDTGFVLFDLLLSNGDSFNRFVEAYFDGREIKKDSICVVSLDDTKTLSKINSHYRGRNNELNNSVLSPSEKYKYSKI